MGAALAARRGLRVVLCRTAARTGCLPFAPPSSCAILMKEAGLDVTSMPVPRPARIPPPVVAGVGDFLLGLPARWYSDRAVRACVILLALVGCGGPVLQNAPRPDPGIIAAAAAAAATAATSRIPTPPRSTRNGRRTATVAPHNVQVNQSVPPDVLDRLDKAEQQRGSGRMVGPR